jgi:DNA-directed RNA polymerase subunit RPC12/RpoP
MSTCSACGAPVEAPEDLVAITARCTYCGRETALPKRLIQERKERREQQLEEEASKRQEEKSKRREEKAEKNAHRVERQVRSTTRWTLLLSLGMTVAITGFAFWRTGVDIGPILNFFLSDDEERPTVAVSPPSTGPGKAAGTQEKASTSADDSVKARDTLVAERMRQANKRGCKRVTMSPTRRIGSAQLQANLVVGPCVRIFVVTDREDEKLTLSVFDPLATPVVKAEYSGELTKDFCPKIAGPYTINIAPANEGSFTIGAADCPKPMVMKQ